MQFLRLNISPESATATLTTLEFFPVYSAWMLTKWLHVLTLHCKNYNWDQHLEEGRECSSVD